MKQAPGCSSTTKQALSQPRDAGAYGFEFRPTSVDHKNTRLVTAFTFPNDDSLEGNGQSIDNLTRQNFGVAGEARTKAGVRIFESNQHFELPGCSTGSDSRERNAAYLKNFSRERPAGHGVKNDLCLLPVGILAGYWPARRASYLDPVEALRHE